MNPRIKKAVSFMVLLSVVVTQSAGADPSAISFAARVSDESRPFSLEVPFELGTIEEQRYPPSTSDSPLVIAIQTIHGHYETALKIKGLVDYFQANQGVNLLFAEGASGPLHPEYLRFTDDKEKNSAVLDELVRKGEITGADLAVSEGTVQGFGVENAASYKKAYELFKAVMGSLEETRRALDKERLALDRRASLVIQPALREIISRWLKFGSGRLELLATVDFLRSQAPRLLGVDFETAFAQFEWPQVTRLVLLSELGRRQSPESWAAEKPALVKKLEDLELDGSFVDFLEAGETEKTPRRRVEQFMAQALPKGFQLKDYPQAVYKAAYRVLENEIDSRRLYEEIEKLFEEILWSSAGSPEEKELVREYKRLILAEKLLRLELSPKDWREWQESDPEAGTFPERLNAALRRAEAFYESMEEREQAFLEAMDKSLRSGKNKTAVFISGGFHGREMMDKLESRGIASVLVTPHISGDLENGIYHKVMLRGATLEQTLLTHEPSASLEQGWDIAAQAGMVRQMLKDEGIEFFDNVPYFAAVEKALARRSELRTNPNRYNAEDAAWDTIFRRYSVDGKIADTRDAEGNPIGKFASTPSLYLDAVFSAMELPEKGSALVIDAGHGTGNLLFRLASRAGKMNPEIRFKGIEGSAAHFRASASMLKEGTKKKLIFPGQVELIRGDFNADKELFRRASVVYYAEAGTRGLDAFAETLHELQPGARLIALGEDQSQPGKLRELLTAAGAFEAVEKEGFPKITVYTRLPAGEAARSELRSAEADYRLVEAALDLKTLFPEELHDQPLDQIIFIADNTGTMVANYGDPLSGPILAGSISLLERKKNFLVVNSGDPLKDLSEKTYMPLLEGLTPDGRRRFNIVADGGSRRTGFDTDAGVRYLDELESWPNERRFEYAKVLAEAFYRELKKRKGNLAEGLKEVSDEDIDSLHDDSMKKLEAVGPAAWGVKQPHEAKYIFDLLPLDFKPGWGRVFIYDVGPKVTFDMPSIRDYMPVDFTPGIMAEVLKTYPPGTEDLYVVSVPGAVDMARVAKIQGVEKTLAAEVYPQLDPAKPLLMIVIGDGDNDIPTFGLKGPSGYSHAVVPVFLRDRASYASRLPEGTFIANEKMAGTAQVLAHLARHAGQKISDIPPLALRQWARSELRSDAAGVISLAGRPKGIELYEKVFSKAPNTTLRVGRDIAHTGALQASAIIKGIQQKRRSYDAAGRPDRDVFIIFATGNTQWLGLTTLASILDDWGKWDDETRGLLTANGVDLTDKPDMGRVFASHLDTIFPQSRDDYYSYANELHSMFDKLGIPREKRRMFYGDVRNDSIDQEAENKMDRDEFEKVQASVDQEGLKLGEYLEGKLAASHPQFAYLDAIDRYTKKMSEFVLAKGPDIALFSAGPSYEGKGHIAFNEAGTPFDQGLVMAFLSYHAAAGNIKDRGGMQYFRTAEGAVKLAGATLGPKEIRSSNPIFITIINGKEKRGSVLSFVERDADPEYPVTALQGGAPGSVLIMESASGSMLRFFTNPWDFSELTTPEWTPEFKARLFVQLSREAGKPASALTIDDWLQAPGKDNAEIAGIRLKNLISLTAFQSWESLRDEVVKTLAREPLKPEEVPARLGLRTGDEIVHIGPHLDDLSLAAQFLVTEFSSRGHRLYSYYTAPGYTAVSDEYALSALATLENFSAEELSALENETRSEAVFRQSEAKYLRQLIKVLSERDLVYDPSNYDTWSLMPAEEQKLRARLLFLRLNFESSLKGELSTPQKVTALREALRIYIKAKPRWGSSEIALMQKIKVALRFVEEQTELMSRGVGYDDIFFPFQSSWYALERKGTARRSDIDVIKDVIRGKKPRLLIVNGEGFMDHGAHSITEMTVKVAVKELYEANALPEGFRMFFYRGVWDRAEITGMPDQILVALGEEELEENKSSFVRNYPSQAPALVPDASVKEPMFFSDQVVTNARETLAEWAALNGRATDDPALQGILAFDMIDFNSVEAVRRFQAEVAAKKAELDRVQVPINRASLSRIIGSAPPFADLSGRTGQAFLSVLAPAEFPFEAVLTGEEIEKTRLPVNEAFRSELRTDAVVEVKIRAVVEKWLDGPEVTKPAKFKRGSAIRDLVAAFLSKADQPFLAADINSIFQGARLNFKSRGKGEEIAAELNAVLFGNQSIDAESPFDIAPLQILLRQLKRQWEIIFLKIYQTQTGRTLDVSGINQELLDRVTGEIISSSGGTLRSTGDVVVIYSAAILRQVLTLQSQIEELPEHKQEIHRWVGVAQGIEEIAETIQPILETALDRGRRVPRGVTWPEMQSAFQSIQVFSGLWQREYHSRRPAYSREIRKEDYEDLKAKMILRRLYTEEQFEILFSDLARLLKEGPETFAGFVSSRQIEIYRLASILGLKDDFELLGIDLGTTFFSPMKTQTTSEDIRQTHSEGYPVVATGRMMYSRLHTNDYRTIRALPGIQFPTSRARVLSLAGGRGLPLAELAPLFENSNMVLLDANGENMREALSVLETLPSTNTYEAKLADARSGFEGIAYPEGTFDLITMVGRSEYGMSRDDLERIVKEAFRVLKREGGYFLIESEGPDFLARYKEAAATLVRRGEISFPFYGYMISDTVMVFVSGQPPARSELRDALSPELFTLDGLKNENQKMAEIPSIRLPFIAEPTGRDAYDTALLLGGIADPLWNSAELNDYRLALRDAIETYYRSAGGEGFGEQVAGVQALLRDSKQAIALFAHIRDISKEEALRQIFDTARFMISLNQAKAHYVVLAVDRDKDAEPLREKLLGFLKSEYPEDAAMRNQIYSRMPIVTASNRLAGSLIPKGALAAWVDWTGDSDFEGMIPEPARARRIQADRLPDGALLKFDEKNRGYGVSLLQAALLLLQGAEESRLQQLKSGLFVQASSSAFAALGQILKALRTISASA